jgi:hypothetical protein
MKLHGREPRVLIDLACSYALAGDRRGRPLVDEIVAKQGPDEARPGWVPQGASVTRGDSPRMYRAHPIGGGEVGPWVTGLLHDATGSYTLAFWIAIGGRALSTMAIWPAAPREVRAVAGRVDRRLCAFVCGRPVTR